MHRLEATGGHAEAVGDGAAKRTEIGLRRGAGSLWNRRRRRESVAAPQQH
ncbi:MAG: hypothetical protein LBD24_08030 [Spirochaetaceae bacterium]|nr:hypothetical protein [Spirochaetaceae bacterium]